MVLDSFTKRALKYRVGSVGVGSIYGYSHGTEELAHVEIIATMVYQIMNNASVADIKAAGLDKYYVLHGKGLYYTDPNGYNWTADYISSKCDPVVDLTRDLAAEEEARITYEWLINLTNDPDIIAPVSYTHLTLPTIA